ncbi:hypothetical protein ACFWNG_23195 [Streptomyces sp. NPDC058391]|uniref:hypothetical protein n=1 Tax=Streptomyces sp. NPDC058391 TaxID=3346476 RepID=UPI00364A0E7B
MMLAGEWYESGNFWAASAVFATLAAGAAAVWAALRAAYPKRRLTYFLANKTRLLARPSGLSEGVLTVTHNGNVLMDPHIVEVQIANTGRRDIPGSLYDNGEPITLEVCADIVELLDITWYGNTHVTPTATVVGSALKVGPTLIPKGQKTSFSLLVDGREPHLMFTASLVDVDIRRRMTRDDIGSWRDMLSLFRPPVFGVFVVLIFVVGAVGWLARSWSY